MMCALVETGLGRESIDGLGHKSSRNDLKVALRQADRQQNAIRKTKTWNTERTAFEQPQPQAVAKKGVRNAIRRQTRKLKQTTQSRPPTAVDDRPPSLFRSDSFDYGDELKRRPTQLHFATPAQTASSHARSDARTELLKVKAQQRQRRVEQKASEKRIKEQEKAQRMVLQRQAKHDRQVKHEKLLQYLRALASSHPRQKLKRIRYGPHEEEHVEQQRYVHLPSRYHHSPVSPESWLDGAGNFSHDLVSPVASPAPCPQFYPQQYVPSAPSVPRWNDFNNKDELLDHLRGGQPPVKALEQPQELPTYERLPKIQRKVSICEAPTDLPDRELQMCRVKPNLVYCDICSTPVPLSGVFYSCTVCGPREGGIVCTRCQQENRKCHGGMHDLESSMQVVQRASPVSTWRAHETQREVHDVGSKNSEKTEDLEMLSRISADTASHSLCLAMMQKKLSKVEVGIETQSKTTERLASWLEEAMERQREQAADLTKSMLDEFRAERIANMNTIKRLSTKRKPRRQSSEGSKQLAPLSRDNLGERETALRERELTLKDREMALQERREAAMERTEKSTPAPNPLPSQSLASTPIQENRILLNVLNKLSRIEGLSTMSLRQAPSFNDKIVEQVVERAMGQLTLVTSSIQEHAGVKRKADSTGAISSIQSTPTTGLSTSSFLQPPARTMSRGNQEDGEGDGHSPKRPKNQPTPTPESGRKLLLACPYSKMEFNRYSHRNVTELNYRGCSSCVLTDISRLKQHLYRVHQYPEHHCPRCFDDLVTKEQLNTHIREGCEPRECPYPEKFSDSSKLKKKWPRKSMTECWYMVYKILFPGHRLPASPYAEDLATGGAAIASPNTPPQPLPTLSLSPEVLSDVVRRQLEQRAIRDPTQHAFLLSLVQDATNEALRLISASPTPITNSNPSSAVLQSGTHISSPGPDSAWIRQAEALDPNLPSAGAGATDSACDNIHNLQDLSSLGSGVNADIHLPVISPTAPAMSSNQSSGTFSGLSPLPGTENLMDFEDDLIQLNSGEIMAPIKPSNSTRTVDSGYGSLLRNDGILDAYSLGGTGVGTSGSSGTGNESSDSLFDPEMYERLRQDHGDDVVPFDINIDLGPGVGGGMFGSL